MLHSLESQGTFRLVGKVSKPKRSGRHHPYKHLRVSIPHHSIKHLPEQPYGTALPEAKPCTLYGRLSTVSPASTCSSDSGYNSLESDPDSEASPAKPDAPKTLTCSIALSRLPNDLSTRLRIALSNLPTSLPYPLNCAHLADIYQRHALACEQSEDYPKTVMATELDQRVLAFYKKPYFSYNRFMERNQYLCHTGDQQDERDVFKHYFVHVDSRLTTIDEHLETLVANGTLSKSESQFLFLFIVRSFLDTHNLASCVDKAGALSADILEHNSDKVIPVMGIVTFFKSKHSYQKFMEAGAVAWDLPEADNHAIVCAMSAKYYQRCKTQKRFTREVIARRPQNVQDYTPPSVLKKDHTVLCDGSTGGRFLYKGEWDWHGYIEDTDELLHAANPDSGRTGLDQGVYRAVVDWHPIF